MAKKPAPKQVKHHEAESSYDPMTKRGVIRKQVLATVIVFLLLIAGTTIFVLYGKGYRFGFEAGKPNVAKTGVLAVKSVPEGAQVFINGNLTATANENLNLAPGTYDIKIEKDGFFPWEKTLVVEKEVVTRANARLFPKAPRLESLTNIGVMNPVIDPTKTKIAYRVASQSARKNGVYVLDMLTPPITLQSASKQIADDTLDVFSGANLAWGPDGTEMLASIAAELRLSNYLLKSTQMNEDPQNVTAILSSVELDWQTLKERADVARMNGLKKEQRTLINDNFSVQSWSPDDTKIMYIASRSAELPFVIKPRLIGINLLTEDRKIETGKVYVYDLKEDTNYRVLDAMPEACEETMDSCKFPLSWFADSNHLIYVHEKRIDIMEYDGSNQTTVYAGPFIDSYVFPWPNGDQLVILTDLNNPQIQPNLYTVGLK